MKPFTALAFAGLAAAQLPSFADSMNAVDTFMRDLHISFHELTTSHPRRSFHRRQSGQLAKRCIPRPANHPGPGGNGTTTTRSASGSTSRTARPTTTRSAPASTTTSRVTSLLISTSSTTTSTTSTTVVFPTVVFPTRTSFTTTSTTTSTTTTSTTSTTPTSTSTTSTTPTTTSTTSTSTSSTSTSTSSPSTTALPSPTPSSSWNLQTTMEGNNFFDAWQFWAYPDPTNGAVDYQTIEGSEAAGLHEINSDGHAIMRVETTPKVTGNRKSVRVHSNIVINGGLVIIDAVHMPYGCGTWPAFWSNGPNWPDGGEIDIIEGVNGYERNQASLHTKTGCTIPENYGSSATLAASVNCAAYETGNQGCGQLGSKPNNYGKSFNDNGGGVYAMKWDTSGISIYFFPREDIPSDIIDEKPQPDKWGTPSGNWPAQNCDPYQFFKDHILIFDTTLCGDWAGNAWHSSGIAGQSQTCAQSTGYDTCLDYIRNEGGAFKDAFWQVKSIKVYT